MCEWADSEEGQSWLFSSDKSPPEVLGQWISNILRSPTHLGLAAWEGALLVGSTPEIVI